MMTIEQVSETPCEKLTRYKKASFLFHGSHNGNIKTIEPRQSDDSSGSDSFNVDKAVFASNRPESTIIFALIRPDLEYPKELGGVGFTVEWVDTQVIAWIDPKLKPFVESATGYVYVLPPETFIRGAGPQFKSTTEVVPEDVIEVSLDDYFTLGGKLRWERWKGDNK